MFVIGSLSSGFYAKLMGYQLYEVAKVSHEISSFSSTKVEVIWGHMKNSNSTHVWVHKQSREILDVLGVDLPARNAHLLEKHGKNWYLIKSWPYPGYNNQSDIKD